MKACFMALCGSYSFRVWPVENKSWKKEESHKGYSEVDVELGIDQ